MKNVLDDRRTYLNYTDTTEHQALWSPTPIFIQKHDLEYHRSYKA